MKTSTAQIGGSTLLIEASVKEVEGTAADRYGTKPTGVKQDARNAYDQLKGLMRDIAADLAETLVIDQPNGPNQMSIELGLTFASGANVWVLSASGEVACTVSMTWEKRPTRG